MIKKLLHATSGYTLVEILVVTTISLLLSSIVIFYTADSRQSTALSVEKTRLVQVLIRARSLALSAYVKDSSICGYGVHFDYANRTYTLSVYKTAISCDRENIIGLPSHEDMPGEKYPIDTLVAFGSQAATEYPTDILFVPPNPETYIWKNETPLAGAPIPIVLQTKNGKVNTSVSVSTMGQISF